MQKYRLRFKTSIDERKIADKIEKDIGAINPGEVLRWGFD
jgi:hypothetical protein